MRQAREAPMQSARETPMRQALGRPALEARGPISPSGGASSSTLTAPVLGAVAVALGVWTASLGASPLAVLAAAALTLAVLLVGRARLGSRLFAALAVAVALVPVGAGRMAWVAAQPDPFAGLEGRTLTLEGDYDGRLLRTAQGTVAVTPRASLAPGRWRVVGTLEPITWFRNPGA